MYVATAAQMREIDRITIQEIGLPGIILMENAAQGLVQTIINAIDSSINTLNLAAFCGRGNNGGDGLAVCRILGGRGIICTAYLLSTIEQIKNEARINLEIARACGVKIVEVYNETLFERYLEVMASHNFYLDGLIGTGLNFSIEGGLYAKAINFLNTINRPILAIDIPSGLCANTGIPLGNAVRANMTATFSLLKIGLALDPGEFTGKLTIVDIGIPLKAIYKIGINCQLLDSKYASSCLNKRYLSSYKGTFGHLLTVGGSVGLSGALFLMAMGGIRAGAGLVTAALPEGLNQVAEIKLTAVMTQPLPQTNEGMISLKALPMLLELGNQRSALVIGPGLGRSEEIKKLVRELVGTLLTPIVIDADGLAALDSNISFKIAAKESVITPHPGEAAQLLGCSILEVQADRVSIARRLAKKFTTVAVLKGARTVIASSTGAVWINTTGNPLLASAGSGDVLAGLIGGLLAQGVTALEAALAAVYFHGLAADLAADQFRRGLAAEELLNYLPFAFALSKKNRKNQI